MLRRTGEEKEGSGDCIATAAGLARLAGFGTGGGADAVRRIA
jgi:hypothetical protein